MAFQAPPVEGAPAPVAENEPTFQTVNYSNFLTEDDRRRLYRTYPITLEKIEENKALSLQDIKNLTRSGVSDDAMIRLIAATRSYYFLTPEDVEELQQAGVSNKVIKQMDQTGRAVTIP